MFFKFTVLIKKLSSSPVKATWPSLERYKLLCEGIATMIQEQYFSLWNLRRDSYLTSSHTKDRAGYSLCLWVCLLPSSSLELCMNSQSIFLISLHASIVLCSLYQAGSLYINLVLYSTLSTEQGHFVSNPWVQVLINLLFKLADSSERGITIFSRWWFGIKVSWGKNILKYLTF